MVVKLVRWPSWPPFSSKKYEAIINIQRLEGLANLSLKDASGLVVEIKWKGQKIMGLGSWRRSVRRNYTEKGNVCDCEGGASVDWNEEFRSLCSFLGSKEDHLITPWKVSLAVFQKGENQVLRNSSSSTIVGTASLNLAEYASSADGKEIQISLPLKVRGSTAELSPSLLLSLNLLELRTDTKHLRMVQRSVMPVTVSPPSSLALSTEKDGLAAIKAGLDRVKIFSYCVSAGRPKEVFHEQEIASVNGFYIKDKNSPRSSSLDSDSIDDDGKEDSCVRQPFGYEKLAHANRVAGLLLPDTIIDNGDECWIHCGSGAGCLDTDNSSQTMQQQNSMRKILSWKKRKLSFKSPKNRGEPLLKKHYGEDGGDDIDFDRRQLSRNELFSGWYNLELSAAAFGEDNFSVGSWEQKEVTSRDGCLKIKAEVFFASIDQRSESVAGESACTALVAVIADWLLSNQDEMPIKSELDNLIRDGSAEWRNLCENEDYMEQFSDKHFDLDTVIDAKVRPLSVVAEKSYVGFFHPEGLEEEGVFEFLKGAMSFDTIWDEISLLAADNSTNDAESLVYIVSWNDHFFILKVDRDAFYIIDTLGERLYEGCNQAYILKFDKETVICRLPNNTKASEEKASADTKQSKSTEPPEEKTSIDAKQSKNTDPSEEKNSIDAKQSNSSTEPSEEETSINAKESKSTEPSEEKKPSTDVPQLNNAEERVEEKPQPSDSEEASTAEEPRPSSSSKEASPIEKSLVEIPYESKNGETEEEEVVCTGKECCQEYVKSFLAAIPIKELQEDLKKGLNSSTPLHQRLQIEFHRAEVISEAVNQILARATTEDLTT